MEEREDLLPVRGFKDLKSNPLIDDWLVLGPFVVETGASFEREYMYERERILEIDYLEASGGERAVRPFEGMECENPFIGNDRLRWSRVKDERVGFTGRTGELLYRTVQRNAVWYAATYVDCDEDGYGFVEFSHSGAKMFVNGVEVLNQPYGVTKGLWIRQPGVPVRFNKGRNIILLKIRPGYIADGIDFHFSYFRIYPAAVGLDGVYASDPEKTSLFFGPLSSPKQAFAVRVANCADGERTLELGLKGPSGEGDSVKVERMSPGELRLVRVGLPSGGEATGTEVTGTLFLRSGDAEASCTFTFTPDEPPREGGTCFVYSDFHFDTTYHEEQRVYAMGAFDICRRYMEQFRRDPNFKGILSEVDYLKPFFDLFPDDRETLLVAFREGSAEADVFYNQPQEINASGEEFVRNLIYGQLFHGDVLGRRCLVYSPGDVFGHPAQMSQISMKGGCMGVSWGKFILGFPPLFRHVSPDGTYLLHRRGRVSREEASLIGISSFLGGADKTPPTDWLKKLVPEVRLAVPSDFHSAVEREDSEKGGIIPLTSRDMSLYHAGTALSRIELKIGNRFGENLLISAEKFATIASMLGAKYPEKPLDKAWRQLLCGQHHDSITGTHNEISYVDLMAGYRESVELASGVLKSALRFISRACEAKPGDDEIPLRVFNPHAWDRRDLCQVKVCFPPGWESFGIRDRRGRAVPSEILSEERDGDGFLKSCEVAFIASVPSLGYSTYYVAKSAERPARKAKRVRRNVVENRYYRIEADPSLGGGLVSIYDKGAGRELLDLSEGMPGNEIAVLREVPDRPEPQHEFYTTGQALFSRNYPAEVWVEEGPVLRRIVVENRLADICDVRQEITLVSGVQRIDFRTYIVDYQAEDDLFAVTFPTNIRGAVPTFDDRYCSVVRRESKGRLDFRTHRMFMFSGCAVHAADRWLDYGPSVILSFRDKGKVISECSIGMTGLVVPDDGGLKEISEALLLALTRKGIPVTPWSDRPKEPIGSMPPDMNLDLLYTDFRVALATLGRPNRYVTKLLRKLDPNARIGFLNRVSSEGSGFLFVVDSDNDENKPVKVLIVVGKDLQGLREAVSHIEEALSDGELVELPAESLAAEPSVVDRYGLSLINTGNIACSVERGGIVTLLLFHTARWYGGTGNIEEGRYFVPERRTHVYNYTLYPHVGSWREAQSYRRGFEVNDPLIGYEVSEEGPGTLLPEEASFLKVSAPNAVVTALKAYGNPMAAFKGSWEDLPDRGVTVRFYEAEGRSVKGSLRFMTPLKRAFSSNLLEEEERSLKVSGNSVRFSAGPFSIETISFFPEGLGGRLPEEQLGPQSEVAQPVFIRSWEHDAGTMPMGYEAVLASIGRDVEALGGGRLRIKVNVVNDYTDTAAEGKAYLILPEGWRADMTEFPYSIPPLGHVTFTPLVEMPSENASGQIKLRFEHDGQEFQDVLEIGSSVEPEFSLRLEGDAIIASVGNPGTEPLEGEIALASPVETWPRECVGDYSLMEISPRCVGFSIGPGRSCEFRFDVVRGNCPVYVSWWAVGKLMTNGRIYLRKVGERGPRRIWSDDRMWEEIRRRLMKL